MAWRGVAARVIADERARFLFVGGFNTAFGFVVFILLDLTLGAALDGSGHSIVASIAVLLAAHAIASLVAFYLYRRFVFRVHGHVLLDLVRFEGVYAVPLAVNVVVLPVLVELGVPRILAQASIIVVTTIFSYVGHRYFSFRRRAGSSDVDPVAAVFAHDAPADGDSPPEQVR